MTIFVNPGTEPLPAATEDNARAAMALFVADCVTLYGAASWDGTFTAATRGRWTGVVNVAGRTHEVDMPGIDPHVTREGRPFVSPRLYVDGGSWLWQFALNVVDPDDQDEDGDL